MIVYVLKCEKNMFYVGSTNRNLKTIFNSTCSFTSKYKPINIVFSKKTHNIFEEDILLKKYMLKYGIHNVRGGYYSSLHLSKSDLNFLKSELFNYIGGCFKCGRKNHIDNKCNAKKDIFGDIIYEKYKTIVRSNSVNVVEKRYRQEYTSQNNIKDIVKNALNCFL